MSEENRRFSNDPTISTSKAESVSEHQTQEGRSTEVHIHQQSHPSRLGKYEIKEQLGAGGMGEVYRAYDSTLNRFVALKILYADKPDSIRRFLEEARIQAGVEHENICKVYEAGEQDGKNYIAMQLINGRTLLYAAAKMSREEKLIVMCKVADTLQAAHQKGLIHRDIKPTNIMIEQTESGEWKPFICDFGLARRSEAPNLTMTGMILGTPPYMAPEQARSDTKRMDARTDVYALGATLFEILSGKPIYEGNNPAEIIVKILDNDPPPIRTSGSTLPLDLQTIVERCVEKNPERRYPSARSLAEDLRRYLQGEPIVARQTTRSYRWLRIARRNKAATVSLTVSAVLILLFTGLFLHSRWSAQRQAKLVAEFGNEVRFIESTIRSAYASPLHDVRREFADIKHRLERFEQRVISEGSMAEGPGYDALGHCYLAMGDYTKAKQTLEKSWNAGYHEPSTAYALGIVIGKAYQDELLKSERLPSTGIRGQKRKEAEEKYGKQAVDYLKKGSTHIESPLYVEALIDLYEKRFDSALNKVHEALKRTSWPYEPKKLEGDIYMRIGKIAQQSGDYKKSLEAFAAAEKAFSEAEELARSNEEIHLALGERFNAASMIQHETGVRHENNFDKALKSCNNALKANPDSGRAYLCLSQAYVREGIYLKFWTDTDPSEFFLKAVEVAEPAEKTIYSVDALIAGSDAYVSLAERAGAVRKDPLPHLQNAINKAQKALDLDPESDAFHSLAGAYFLMGDHELYHGGNPMPALEKVVQIYHEGRKEVSYLEYMQNVLALAFLDMGEYKMQFGEDPRVELLKSIKHSKRGLQINPNAHYIASNAGLTYLRLAAFEFSHGQNPTPNCAEALRYYEQSMAETPDAAYAQNNKGLVYLLLAEYDHIQHKDPEATLSKALHHFQTAAKLNADLNFSFVNMASAFVLRSEYRIRMNQNPISTLKLAEESLDKSFRSTTDFFEAHRVLGEVRSLAARYSMVKGRSPLNELVSARKALEESLRINPLDGLSYFDLARTYRYEAVWWKNNKISAAAAAQGGLEWIQKSKDKKIQDAKITALEGVFYLILARNAEDGTSSVQHASRAFESLEKALKANPLLNSEYSDFLKEAAAAKR